MSDLSSVCLSNREDGWRWLGDSTGSSFVKSVKFVLSEATVNRASYVLNWNKWVPSKCNFFVWKAVMYRIPTADALSKRGIVVADGLCPLCKSEADLFTSCYIAVIMWQKVL
uniref:Putative reverse transcriptase zinc-binding domain-containing protein n=1 Tax=Helianthus annuus TaxID=4232 RepID=A0A251T0L8_HELAN